MILFDTGHVISCFHDILPGKTNAVYFKDMKLTGHVIWRFHDILPGKTNALYFKDLKHSGREYTGNTPTV